MSTRPPAGPLRTAVERRSATLLVVLSRQPRWLLPVASALLLAGVVFLPAPAAVPCLAILVAFIAWLTYLSWPVLDNRGRAIRLACLVLLLTLGVQSVG